jgi:hypothetical protein
MPLMRGLLFVTAILTAVGLAESPATTSQQIPFRTTLSNSSTTPTTAFLLLASSGLGVAFEATYQISGKLAPYGGNIWM